MDDTVLFFETSEDIPAAWTVQYALIAIGERGWFDRIKGVLVGRAKAWEFDQPNPPGGKARYKEEQRQTVIDTVRQYHATIPIIQNLDFGHTDPQVMIPNGLPVNIDGANQRITVDYGPTS